MKILRISESSSEFRLPQPNESLKLFSCNCFDLFHTMFSRTFYQLGYFVGKYPSYFIVIPFFISILGLTGFQRINYEKDSDYLFIPSNGESKLTRELIEDLFPSNTSQLFDISRISRPNNFAKIYITAKDGGTMFRTKLWKEVVLLDNLIQNITISWNGEQFQYKDMCAMWYGQCYHNIIYNLNDLIPEVENGTAWISYPIMLFPFVLPMFFGGTEINEEEGVLISAKALLTIYWLRQDDIHQRERAFLWEGKLLEMLDEIKFANIKVDRYTSRSVPDELEKNTEALMNYLPFALLLLLGFCVGSLITLDWVRSKIQMGILGIFTVILSIFSSFGLLMYIGVPFIGINTAGPFLILGIGLDDMFVMLSAWRKTKIQDSIPNRVAMTYSRTAISITITSLTNMCAFFVGTYTSFPGIKIFCIYLGVSVIFTYFWFITFFGACLAIVGRQEKHQRHSLICWKVKAKSESEDSCLLYKALCTGGISKKDPWNPEDNRPCEISLFFREKFASAINTKKIQGCILLLYVAYFIGSLYGCFQIKDGLDPKSIAVDGSYLADFFDVESQYFRKFPYRIQVIIKGNLSYNEKETKVQIMQLHRSLENLTFVGPRLYTRSWIRGFLGYLGRRPQLRNNITNEQSFISVLNNNFMDPFMKESLDVVYNEDQTRILASRFIIQGYEVEGMEGDKDMINGLREVANQSPLDVSVFHPIFVYFDQTMMVKKTAAQSIALASFIILVVSFIFIPNPLSSICVAVSILSVQIGVIGFMSLWNVRLDSISIVNLIISIGFSVDFSAHIVYYFVTSKFTNSDEKVRDALYHMGVPILQCSMSTILGIVLFILVPSYIYRTFFKIIFLVSLIGTIHALIILPTVLSLTSSVFCKNQKSNNTNLRATKKSKACFTNNTSDILKDKGLHCDLSKSDSSYESSSLSRFSSLSESKSVKSESLRSSQGSSGLSSETDSGINKNKTSCNSHTNAEVEYL